MSRTNRNMVNDKISPVNVNQDVQGRGSMIASKNDGNQAAIYDNRQVAAQNRSGSVTTTNAAMTETTVPNFLLKLWKLVEDRSYDFCIAWDESGTSFHVKEPYVFSKDVLPLFFKHSNLNSFIRQLNMYGFRKVTSLEQGALKHQPTDMDSLEFHHQCFMRGHPELLQYIKRKTSTTRTSVTDLLESHSSSGDGGNGRALNSVLEEVRQMREKQYSMDAKLHQVKKENETLWREIAHMRQLHMKQQQVVTKLMQFLVAAVQPARGSRLGKRNILAIAPDHPSKRIRMNPSDVVGIIESFEQELRKPSNSKGDVQSGFLMYTNSGNGRGPTIADITEEPELGIDPMAGVATETVQPTTGYTLSPNASAGTSGYTLSPADSVHSDVGQVEATAEIPDTTMAAMDPSALMNMGVPVTADAMLSQQAPQLDQDQGTMQMQPWTTTGDQQVVTTTNYGASGSGYISPPVLLSPGAAELQEWSKPEFSQYLDYVQTDLDLLKDFLTSEGLNMDNGSLDDLFTTDESSMAGPPPSSSISQSGGIVGNELQVYQEPQCLIDFDFGNNTQIAAGNQDSIGQQQQASPQVTSPITSSSSMVNQHPTMNMDLRDQQHQSPDAVFATPVVPAMRDEDLFVDAMDADLFSNDLLMNTVPESPLRTPIMSPVMNSVPIAAQEQKNKRQQQENPKSKSINRR